MSGFDSVEKIYMILGMLTPGIIILYVRSQFLTGRFALNQNAVLSYLTVSFVYFAIVFPFFDFRATYGLAQEINVLEWIVFIFILPCAAGLFLGIDIQRGVFRRLLNGMGFYPVHTIPTAWDWKFSTKTGEEWVLVTLKDDTKFAGFLGKHSFISSDPAERDIYIQWVYDIKDDNTWVPRKDCGVLISGSEVKTMEFWPYEPESDPP